MQVSRLVPLDWARVSPTGKEKDRIVRLTLSVLLYANSVLVSRALSRVHQVAPSSVEVPLQA
jgi:hypothetical protein